MIINADDFGYSKSVNRAIADCFEKGLINRTTIMVNMPHAAEAAEIAKSEGFFDKVGLHINFTEGKALSKECALSDLCDDRGYFKGVFHVPFFARLYLPSKVRNAIYAETKAQIKKFIDMGFTLRHADSHNYTHSYMSVYSQVKKLLQKYGFTSVRISRNVSSEGFKLPFMVYKALFNFVLRHLRVNNHCVETTRYFCSVQDYIACSNPDVIKHDLELMTHPDYVDGVLIDNTLPLPHPFVTKEWINENHLHMEDVSGKKLKLFVGFIQVHIGGAMTSLVNFLNALDTDKYDVDVMFLENTDDRCGIKDEIHILPQGRLHQKFSIINIARKVTSVSYLWASVLDWYYKKIKHNKRRAVQIMSKQGCRYSRRVSKSYDVAIAYEFNWCLNYVMRYVRANRKILWHHLEYDKSGMDFSVDKKSLDQADALVFVSEDCRESYVSKHPEHGNKSYFIPNLLSSEYVRSKGNEEVTLPFECNEQTLTMVTVARISFEHKGLDRAVSAFAKLKDDGLLANVRWLIIGKGRDLQALENMIKDLGLSEYIYPIGVRENPIPYLKKCDVFLLPSRHEGKPMVITESFIMGLVPVVTAYTSAREQIRDRVDGIVLDNDDLALYEGLKELLNNPAILDNLKDNISNTDYGNEKQIALFDELIEKIM